MHNPGKGSFTLADGREVYLTRLLLTRTYEGVLEGAPAAASRHIRKRLAVEVGQSLRVKMPVAVIDEGQPELPSYQWVATFDSSHGVKTKDPDYSSRLAICWFSDALPSELHSAIVATLARVDWDTLAEDYDIMP